MMIDPQTWVGDVLAQLKQAFGARLLYLGLQGSYRRQEATEESDIDLVVLLDSIELRDLDTYRTIVRAMPEGHKSCGFISDVTTFVNWPRHELFPFKMDTTDYYGKLDAFMPPVSREDIAAGVKISVSALLHFITHSYLYANVEERSAILKGAFKSAFFAMLVDHYLETGSYQRSKNDLVACLAGIEREIVVASQDFVNWMTAHSEDEAFTMLLGWCQQTLAKSYHNAS